LRLQAVDEVAAVTRQLAVTMVLNYKF